jgi:hypothetical protein
MPKEASTAHLTLALNTMLEREFVSPLTSIRGALEIMRDFADLSAQERDRFLNNALQDCLRLELGVEQLASAVYSADDRQLPDQSQTTLEDIDAEYAERIRFYPELQMVEVDLSNLLLSSSKMVNDFYDTLDRLVENTGERWYVVVNQQQCSVWPEAWVAFALRGKKVNVNYSLGTVYYVNASSMEDTPNSDPELLGSRDEAVARIEQIRKAKLEK